MPGMDKRVDLRISNIPRTNGQAGRPMDKRVDLRVDLWNGQAGKPIWGARKERHDRRYPMGHWKRKRRFASQ